MKRECLHPEEIPVDPPTVKISKSWGDRFEVGAPIGAGIFAFLMAFTLIPCLLVFDYADRKGYRRGAEFYNSEVIRYKKRAELYEQMYCGRAPEICGSK